MQNRLCGVVCFAPPPTLKSRRVNAAFLLLSIAFMIDCVIDYVVFLYLFVWFG